MSEDEVLEICAICGEATDYYQQGCSWYCEECYSNEFESTCSECGSVHDTDEMYDVDDEWYCDDCYHNKFGRCDDCDKIILHDDATEVSNERYVCKSCLSDNYYKCNDCGCYIDFYRDDCYYIESEGYDICQQCYEDGGYTYCDICSEYYLPNKDYKKIPEHLWGYCLGCYQELIERFVSYIVKVVN